MSVTQDHGDIVFQCDRDRCRETLETHTSNFSSALNAMRRAKWRPVKHAAGEWQHVCPDCQRVGMLV